MRHAVFLVMLLTRDIGAVRVGNALADFDSLAASFGGVASIDYYNGQRCLLFSAKRGSSILAVGRYILPHDPSWVTKRALPAEPSLPWIPTPEK